MLVPRKRLSKWSLKPRRDLSDDASLFTRSAVSCAESSPSMLHFRQDSGSGDGALIFTLANVCHPKVSGRRQMRKHVEEVLCTLSNYHYMSDVWTCICLQTLAKKCFPFRSPGLFVPPVFSNRFPANSSVKLIPLFLDVCEFFSCLLLDQR